jgi:hypothetical protein
MRISFDLDDTLILANPDQPCESVDWYFRQRVRRKLLMKFPGLLITVLALIASSVVNGDSDVEVKDLGKGRYLLILKNSRTTKVDVAQAELMPAAKALCKGKSADFGRYDFEGKEKIDPRSDLDFSGTMTLKQEIECVDPAKQRDDAQNYVLKALAWPPGEPEQKAVEASTYKYFAAKDSGSYRDAYSLLTVSMQATTSFEHWSESAKNFNSVAGKVSGRQIKKITWYKDPPSASQPGIYAAADFVSEFANAYVHCGYVVWHQQNDGTFRLVREEESFLDRKSAEKLDEKTRASVKAKLGCK